MKNFLYLLLFLFSFQGIAQTIASKDYYLIDSLDLDKLSALDKNLLDSCLKVYHSSLNDSTKIEAISVVVEDCWDDNVWPKYNDWIYVFVKNKLKAKPQIKNKRFLLISLAGSLNNIGYNYKYKGEIEKALDYYHKSLKIQEKLGDKINLATSLNNIGLIYDDQGDVENALKYYHNSLEIQEEIDDKQGIARSLSNIGLVYFHEENITKAIQYYHKSMKIQEEIGDDMGLAISSNNLAAIYSKQGNSLRALEYYEKSMVLEGKVGNKKGVAYALNNMGRVYSEIKNYKEASHYCNKSLNMAQELGFPSHIRNASITLSEVYKKQNKGLQALEMYELYINMRDSINNEKTQKATIRQQAKYEYELQKAKDDAEHEKILAIEYEEKIKQQILTFSATTVLIMVIIFLVFVFNRLKITRKQKMIIEEQKKEIIDSINYAKRIQEAMLPHPEIVKELLPDSFIYYQPKDIVAGDFYWIEKVVHEGRNREPMILFAAADCTGHGVPGAMVSVVCHNAMNRVISDNSLTDPGKILDKTNEIVVNQLNKTNTFNKNEIDSIRDGMDIALCMLNTKTNTLQYSGATNPLWIIRKGEDNVEEIKATKQSIGKVENRIDYLTHHVELNKGDSIYIFSDGYADQFGGEKGKKLKYKPFKKLLISLRNESMKNQMESIHNHFNHWKGNLEQVDDVCVIGVRI
jgi:serine phosphatase RsbU (regulator of sigma subunit)